MSLLWHTKQAKDAAAAMTKNTKPRFSNPKGLIIFSF